MSDPVSPDPPDWESIADQGRWDEVTDEQVVTAFQAMRRTAHVDLVNKLSDRITTRLLEIVRRSISRGLPDEGWGAVEEAMDHLGLAILEEKEADGKALGSKFELTAKRRATDAVRRAIKDLRRRGPTIDVDDERTLPPSAVRRPSQEQAADVAKVLALLPDNRERLAFLLDFDDAPMTGEDSICDALGVSRPTAKKILDKARRRVEAALRSRPQIRRSP